MKRWCLGAILLLLAAAVTAAAVTRAGYVDFWNNGADAEDYIVELTGSQTGGETLKAYDDNMQKAELVARVQFTGERELKHQCMLSAVSVTEVYRGDPALAGAVIDLYEVNWFAVSDDLGRVYRNFSPANLMTEGDDYLIFANRKGGGWRKKQAYTLCSLQRDGRHLSFSPDGESRPSDGSGEDRGRYASLRRRSPKRVFIFRPRDVRGGIAVEAGGPLPLRPAGREVKKARRRIRFPGSGDVLFSG